MTRMTKELVTRMTKNEKKYSEYNIDFDFTPTPSQMDLWSAVHDRANKYILANFSRQQGKTTIIKALCIEYLIKRHKNIGYITPTKTLAKKIYNDIKQCLEPTGVIYHYNSVFHTIRSITYSNLKFYSSEQMNSIRGETFDYLIIDEAAFLYTQEDNDIFYNILYPTIKVKGKKIIAISTPNGKSGFWYDLIQKAEHGEKGYKYIKKTIYDDGLISGEEIEGLKKSYPELAWRQEFMCEFLDNAMTAIPDFEKCFKECHYNDKLNQWIGIDLSANGEDATIVTFINSDNQTRQVEVKGSLDTKYQKIAELINGCNNLVGAYIENNGVGEPMLNEIMKKVKNKGKVHYWTTTNTTKTEIINLLSVKCSNDEIIFDINDRKLYSEFSTFIYKLSKTRKAQYEAKPGFHDDRVMSMAIAVNAQNDFKYWDAKADTVFIRTRNKNFN